MATLTSGMEFVDLNFLGRPGIIATAIYSFTLAWVFTWVGTLARSAQSVQGISMMIMFPLTFMSNALVPVETLPGWASSADTSAHTDPDGSCSGTGLAKSRRAVSVISARNQRWAGRWA